MGSIGKMKRIRKKTKLEFLWNSNMIEGIEWDIGLYNDRKFIVNIPEIKGHKLAFEYMLKNCETNLTEKKILIMHKLLTEELLASEKSGVYRKCNVSIGGVVCFPPITIKPFMEKLILLAKKAKTFEECWECHHEFEVIHPFVDGNGRVGRLALNWLLLKNKFSLEIIEFIRRREYYNKMSNYRFYRILDWDFFKERN